LGTSFVWFISPNEDVISCIISDAPNVLGLYDNFAANEKCQLTNENRKQIVVHPISLFKIVKTENLENKLCTLLELDVKMQS
jgi:hypothetical protein